MLNITQREFKPEIWNQMVIDSVTSRKDKETPKHICRVIYPDNTCTLELKTDQEIKKHFQQYGKWNANCGKMQLSEIINITRINSLNSPVTPELKDPLSQSLNTMASRAEKKYQNGFLGTLRKVSSLFFNLFVTKSASLFAMPQTNVSLRILHPCDQKNKLPILIGNDAKFARLVAARL